MKRERDERARWSGRPAPDPAVMRRRRPSQAGLTQVQCLLRRVSAMDLLPALASSAWSSTLSRLRESRLGRRRR